MIGAEKHAWIGLGGNLGEARATIEEAVRALGRLPSVKVEAVSGLYRTSPVDASGPDYVNAVARIGRLSFQEFFATTNDAAEEAGAGATGAGASVDEYLDVLAMVKENYPELIPCTFSPEWGLECFRVWSGMSIFI